MKLKLVPAQEKVFVVVALVVCWASTRLHHLGKQQVSSRYAKPWLGVRGHTCSLPASPLLLLPPFCAAAVFTSSRLSSSFFSCRNTYMFSARAASERLQVLLLSSAPFLLCQHLLVFLDLGIFQCFKQGVCHCFGSHGNVIPCVRLTLYVLRFFTFLRQSSSLCVISVLIMLCLYSCLLHRSP